MRILCAPATFPAGGIDHPRAEKLRETCRNNNDTAFYMQFAPRLSDEELCNLMLTLLNQTIVMLNKLIDLVKVDFLQNGGIKEQMLRARLEARSNKH